MRDSKTHFARTSINTSRSEQLLNFFVETPLAAFSDRYRDPRAIPAIDDKTEHAARALFILQPSRAGQGLDPQHANETVDDILDQDGLRLHALVVAHRRRYEIAVIHAPRERFFYPCTGYFPLPRPGRLPAIAFPVLPHVLFVQRERDGIHDGLDDIMRKPGVLTAFSTGCGGGLTTSVVVPPQLVESVPDETVRRHVMETARQASELFALTARMAVIAGLPGFAPLSKRAGPRTQNERERAGRLHRR